MYIVKLQSTKTTKKIKKVISFINGEGAWVKVTFRQR